MTLSKNPFAFPFDDVTLEHVRKQRSCKWSTYPSDVLAAWVAQMDFPIAPVIRDELLQSVLDSDVGYATLTQKPMDALRAVFAQRYKRLYGWSPIPQYIGSTVDVSQGLYNAICAFTEPGDGVIVQTPIYPPFLRIVREAQRTLVINPLRANADGTYEIDFEHLAKVINPRTRMLMLCNPHNPSGHVMTRQELIKLAEFAEKHDWFVASDEIHADITYSGHKHIPFASLDKQTEARTITFTSATKAFNIPGLCFAVAASGSAALQKQFDLAFQSRRGMVSNLGLRATMAAWQHGDSWLSAAVAYLESNRDHVAQFFKKYLPQGVHTSPEATYLAWIDCRALQLTESTHDFFLDNARVALGKGETFGDEGIPFVRLNFATSRRILDTILERMAHAITNRVSKLNGG